MLAELIDGLGGVRLELAPMKPDQVIQVVMLHLERFLELLNSKALAKERSRC